MEAVTWIGNHIWSLLAVCVAFGFIIAIHELGHFIMARRVGIRCPKFAIGFGPRLFSFDFRGTEFSVCLLPLGGYVMMLGEDPESDEQQEDFDMVSSYLPDGLLPASRDDIAAALEARGEELDDDDEEDADSSDSQEAAKRLPKAEIQKRFRSVLGHVRYLPDRVYNTCRELEGNFNDKTIPQRMAVVLGGVSMNFISALILFWIIGACYGLVDLSPKSLPIVMKVFDNSPAATAGLAYGDEITEVQGQTVVSGGEMVRMIGERPGQKTDLKVKRGDQVLDVEIVPNALIGNVVFNPASTENGLPKVVEISALGAEPATKDLAAGDVITAVNGQPIASFDDLLAQFRKLADEMAASQDKLESRQVKLSRLKGGEATLKLYAFNIAPVGKIGIMPAQVTEFRFLEHTTNTVQSVTAGSLAEKVGFKAGDVIYYVNGARVADLESLNEVLSALSPQVNAEHPLSFEVARDGQYVPLQCQQGISDAIAMGLTMEPITMPLVVKRSFTLIGRLIIAPVIIAQQLISKALSPDLVKASMSGPLGIMQMIFELSNDGLGKLLYITALINAAVGAFNVIPFPALDGARFVVLLFGWVRGKELDARKEAMVHQVGLFILLGFVLLVTFLDVQRIFAGVPLTQ